MASRYRSLVDIEKLNELYGRLKNDLTSCEQSKQEYDPEDLNRLQVLRQLMMSIQGSLAISANVYDRAEPALPPPAGDNPVSQLAEGIAKAKRLTSPRR